MERHRPFTLNEKYHKKKAEYVTEFAVKRHPQFASVSPSKFTLHDGGPAGGRTYAATEENLLQVLSAYGVELSSIKQLATAHEDEYMAELDVISHVATYFEIASNRIVDDIPKVFETVFARWFGESLAMDLASNLKLVGDGGVETCRRYVRDEPDVQMKRDSLTRQQKILKQALDKVDKYY